MIEEQIIMACDDHFGTHAGRRIFENMEWPLRAILSENCLEVLRNNEEMKRTRLLVLHLIEGTCGNGLADEAAGDGVRQYMEEGRPLLLLHGASAAFWHWPWWRTVVGFRWVRNPDPDGVAPSTHPRRPYSVRPAKCRHPLVSKLLAMDLPEDEIYIGLEQVCPAWTLMETQTEEGTFPMAWMNRTPWGGQVAGFLPGHKPEVVVRKDLLANVRLLVDALLEEPA